MIKLASLGLINSYFDALRWVKHHSPNGKMMLADLDTAYQGLRNFIVDGTAVEVGDYLLLYSVSPTWYSPHAHLIEELIIRFKKQHHNPVEDVVSYLDVLAVQLGCRAIVGGDTQIGIMGPKYLASGFVQVGTQYFKEVHNGLYQEDHGGARSD